MEGAFVILNLLIGFGLAEIVHQDSDGMSGTIQFGGNDMNDEMMNSPFVPEELQCDACIAVSFQVCLHICRTGRLYFLTDLVIVEVET